VAVPPSSVLDRRSVSGRMSTGPIAPTSVTSRPSSIHVMPSAMTTRQCHRDQGSRSSRVGTSDSNGIPGATDIPAQRWVRRDARQANANIGPTGVSGSCGRSGRRNGREACSVLLYSLSAPVQGGRLVCKSSHKILPAQRIDIDPPPRVASRSARCLIARRNHVITVGTRRKAVENGRRRLPKCQQKRRCRCQ
jgi:hypothetical protein